MSAARAAISMVRRWPLKTSADVFVAQMLTHIGGGDKPVTILTAASGDTGAAVAHAFYGTEMCGSSFSTRAVRSVVAGKLVSVRWAAAY